jgi:hypothetical protein
MTHPHFTVRGDVEREPGSRIPPPKSGDFGVPFRPSAGWPFGFNATLVYEHEK